MYGIPVCNIPWEKAIKEVDICLLAIPYGARDTYLTELSKNKNAVYVEKPLALSLKEHQKWCNLFPPGKLAVGFQRRFYSCTQVIKSINREGIFGEIQSIKLKQGSFILKGGSSYISDEKLAAGGVIAESAVHLLDQITYSLDVRDPQVNSIKSIFRGAIDYDSIFSGTLDISGLKVKYDAEISTLRNFESGVWLHYKTGVLYSSMQYNSAVLFWRQKDSPTFKIKGPTIDNVNSIAHNFYLMWNDFIMGLEMPNIHLPSAAYTSAETSSWLETIYLSMKGKEH
jgi:predicted dehydrogenase